MGKRTRIYEAAVDKVLADAGITEAKDITPGHHTLMQMASDLDSDQERLADAAAWVAEQFSRYAKEVRYSPYSPQDPSGSSTVRDVAVLASRVEQRQHAFVQVARLALGERSKVLHEEVKQRSFAARGLDSEGFPVKKAAG